VSQEDTDLSEKRRSVLKSIGAGALSLGALGATSGGAAADGAADPMDERRLSGREARAAVRAAKESFDSSDLKRKVAGRYSLSFSDAAALETKLEMRNEWTTNVYVPLEAVDGDSPSLHWTAGSDDSPDQIAWYHWTDDASSENLFYRDATVGDVLDLDGAHADAPARLDPADLATEFISDSRHTVVAYSPHEARTTEEGGPVTQATFDLDRGTVSTTELDGSDVDPEGFCPTDLVGIVTAIASAGGGCAVCASAAVGAWPLVFACITCGAGVCGLGCCLGEYGGSTVCGAANTVASAPSFLVPLGSKAGAGCVLLGCETDIVCNGGLEP